MAIISKSGTVQRHTVGSVNIMNRITFYQALITMIKRFNIRVQIATRRYILYGGAVLISMIDRSTVEIRNPFEQISSLYSIFRWHTNLIPTVPRLRSLTTKFHVTTQKWHYLEVGTFGNSLITCLIISNSVTP